MSGQKVNEDKSRLTFSPNTQEGDANLFQSILKIKATPDLGLYLGLPLSHKRPNRSQVQFIMEKVRRKLANWKTAFLSKAGRLCLIQSTLSTIPAYYMQAIALPKATSRSIDQICNNFLWGDSGGKNKLHLVDREPTFLPKSAGGLGICHQESMNTALMAKLGWKLSQEDATLASKCIFSKYIHKNHVTKFKYGSPVWKSVGKGWDLLGNNSAWILGNGQSVSVWKDRWLGVRPLRELVSGPLSPIDENLKVSDLLVDNTWNLLKISTPLPDHLSSFILSLSISANRPDSLVSSFVGPRGFSVAQAYKALRSSSHLPPATNLNWLWRASCLPKLKFFPWLVWRDRLPHRLLLATRRIVPSSLCPCCTLVPKNCSHLLRECSLPAQVWALVPGRSLLTWGFGIGVGRE